MKATKANFKAISCKKCGTIFPRKREHGEFCSTKCRVLWNYHEKRKTYSGNVA